MGKATGLMKELSGKIGPLQFQQTKSGKVAVFVAPEVPDTPLRTKKQMEIRLAWGNLGAVCPAPDCSFLWRREKN